MGEVLAYLALKLDIPILDQRKQQIKLNKKDQR